MGYTPAKRLLTYELDITHEFPPLIQRVISSGEKNARIRIRGVDKSKFDAEARLILDILNDAWSDNWGFVPFTDTEIAYAGKKFKPIVREDLIMVAEYDGEPVAFMMTLPDLNEVLKPMGGSLFPFNWAKLLLWLRKPKVRTMRVPLMVIFFDGVRLALRIPRSSEVPMLPAPITRTFIRFPFKGWRTDFLAFPPLFEGMGVLYLLHQER